MQVQHAFLQQRTPLPSAAINRSMQRRIGTDFGAVARGNRVDNVRLSPQGQMANVLESLAKQKESINKQKNDLITRTMDRGGSLNDIKEQLSFYEAQLKQIDEQVAAVYEQQAQSIAQQQKEKNNTYTKQKPKTKEEAAMQQLHTLSAADLETENAQKIYTLQKGKEQEIRIEEAEIKGNERFITDLESKGLDGMTKVDDLIARERQTIAEKTAHIQELQENVDVLSDTAAQHMQQVQNELEQNQELTATQKEEKEEEENKGEKQVSHT